MLGFHGSGVGVVVLTRCIRSRPSDADPTALHAPATIQRAYGPSGNQGELELDWAGLVFGPVQRNMLARRRKKMFLGLSFLWQK